MRAASRQIADCVDRGHIPDMMIRAGIRRLCRTRLWEIMEDDPAGASALTERFVASMDRAPIALLPDRANDQHYEVPAEFFEAVLGRRRKYSACLWHPDTRTLDDAELLALQETAAHAGLVNGMRILELGCGWGSLTLWMAQHLPDSRIVAVSNSQSQRACIEAAARRLDLDNVEIITADMNNFAAPGQFDRVVSVEMFEHMRNWRALFGRVHDWLLPGGRFFMHVFCHHSTPYAFEDRDATDWMSRHFFTGGMMPSDDLPLRFQGDLRFVHRWRWSGTHYAQTANAWLANLDARQATVMPVLAAVYGRDAAAQWLQRWRVFFMACAELFGYDNGRQWWVSHYLFERPAH